MGAKTESHSWTVCRECLEHRDQHGRSSLNPSHQGSGKYVEEENLEEPEGMDDTKERVSSGTAGLVLL